MPQKRSVPFSGKKKKEQIQAKRKLKSEGTTRKENVRQKNDSDADRLVGDSQRPSIDLNLLAVHQQQHNRSNLDINRYALKFKLETREELEQRKQESYEPISPEPESRLEKGCDEFFPEGLHFPKRPPWDPTDDEASFDAKENRYFLEYCKPLMDSSSYFDLNLETWRQLWRVIEKSDILMVIVDIRFASLHFPPSLYDYIVNEKKKKMILVMNKIDLVPASVVAAWHSYFKSTFPELSVVFFTSLPSYNLANPTASKMKGAKLRGNIKMAAEGALRLFEECEKIVEGKVDLSSWKKKIEIQLRQQDAEVDDVKSLVTDEIEIPIGDEKELFQGGILTIGAVGHPNVGKSSVLNALIGRKVVSISKTPGHTKHFQTVHLTEKVQLLDCPGLVFPSKAPKSLQVLAGCFPVSQLREPYTAVKLLSQHLNIPSRLHLQHQEGEEGWSTFDICEAWAVKRGFYTRKGGKPDVSRAANSLLRIHVDGALGFYLRPPEFLQKTDYWERDPLISAIKEIQALGERKPVIETKSEDTSESEHSESDDEESLSPGPSFTVSNTFAGLEIE